VQVLVDGAEAAYTHYLELLNQDEDGRTIDLRRTGVARELARANLPVSFYTQWYWKIDLHNLLHFLELRLDRRAQYEIRQYAAVILGIVKVWVPLTYEAFIDYRLGRLELSKRALEVVRRMGSAGEEVDFAASGLSRREWDELAAAIRQ
jgi:thymidylate synthase (FAD)